MIGERKTCITSGNVVTTRDATVTIHCSVGFVQLATGVSECLTIGTLDGFEWYLLTAFCRFNN